jgi:pimeloyl-ACP methyl ester carboxylesterase
MFKKTLISLAVASSLGLTGCFDSADTGANANPDYKIEDTTIDRSIVRPIYDPNPIAEEPAFPINADLILLLGATQSANYDFTGLSTGTSPADDAINELSGFSTSGAFTLKFDGSLNPLSVQAGATVFLLPLNVKDAVEGVPEALPNTNPSSIDQTAPFDLASIPNFRADVVSVDGGSDNAIRVVPLEPLAEGQKYLVVATNNIVGADGQPIERSVQDVNLADGVLGNPALASVKSILQASDALANGFLAQAIPQDTPESALAYTFTTNSDTDVLRAMMAPAAFGSALGQKIGFTAQLKAVRDNYPELNFSELTTKLGEIATLAAQLQAGDIDPSDLDAQELASITALATVAPLTEPADLQAAIGAEIGDTLHLPVPRPSFFNAAESASDLATIQGLAAQDASNPIVLAAQQVQVSQGAIALPYFQSLPGETGAGIVTGSWTGSTSLEEDLNENLAPGQTVFSFLRDIDGSLNTNGYFPFPQQNATTTVPVVVFHPVLDDPATTGTVEGPAACAADGDATKVNGVTIFQHGITVDRSVSMLPAILLAQSTCQAIVAIDQPLHGLAGANTGTVAGLTELDAQTLTGTVEATIQGLEAQNNPDLAPVIAQLNALISADYIGERHFGYTANASLQPVAADLADISSGSLFINPLNMMNSRDNLRQGVVDLLNVAASIQTFDLNKDFAPGDLAGVQVNLIGHSLGGISGTVFASLANDATLNATLNGTYAQAGAPLDNFTFPTLGSVVLHNTSGQVTRLIENSPAFSGQVLGGLANAGVTQGTSDFESFFYVFQSISDAGDPVNFAKGLGESTAAAGTSLLITEVVGDTTVPNEANVNPLSPAFSAPLTGTEALMALLDLGAGGTNLADGNDLNLLQAGDTSGANTPVAVFFDGSNPCTTANHGTFVAPIVPNEACGGVADTSAAFSVMVTQTARALSNLSVPATPSNIDALGTSPTLANALDQDEQLVP